MPDRVILHVDMDAFFVSVELLRRPSCAGARSWSGARDAVASWPRRRTRPGGSGCSRRCPRCGPAGCARARCSCPATTTPTPRPAPRCSRSSARSPRTSSRSRSTRRSSTSPGRSGLFGRRIGVAMARADPRRGRRANAIDVFGRRRPNMFLAKMASVEAKPKAGPHGVDPGPGVFEVRPGARSTTCIRSRCGACGASGRRPTSGSAASASARSATSPLSRRLPFAASSARPRRPACWSWRSGIDDRPVDSERPIKSVSHEETFAFDLHGRDDLRTELARLADGVASRLRADGLAARTISLKVRDATFRTITRAAHAAPAGRLRRRHRRDRVWPARQGSRRPAGVRLLGVAASKFAEPAEQLQLDGLGDEPDAAVERRQQGDRPGARAASAARRSGRRAPCRRPGCGSCAVASTSGGPTSRSRVGKDAAPRALRNRCERVRMSLDG